jgi:sporulation protein YlmC with PRC-barrel domain
MNKLMVVSLAGLMAVPAIAQDTTPAPTNKAPPAATQPDKRADAKMAAGQISASKLLNESVLNQANESIGDINDVILDNSGKVVSVVVGVGGFLGMGEKDVALSFDQLTFATDNDGDLTVTTNATKESLQAAPEYQNPDKRM